MNTSRDRTVVTFECRKHLDLSFFWYANFRWPNFGMMLERWFFNVVCVYTFWGYAYWLAFVFSGDLLKLLILHLPDADWLRDRAVSVAALLVVHTGA